MPATSATPEGPLRIGLTGGIASGKTTVARILHDLGAQVIDTDEIARQVVEPGTAGLRAVVDSFGAEVLDEGGKLDREQLRRRVFRDPDARKHLEAILHPLIRGEMLRQASQIGSSVQVFVIPLLTESGLQGLVDRVLVVDCPEDLQLQRLLQRDGETKEQAERILAAQAKRHERLAIADDVVVNDAGVEQLEERVSRLFAEYRQAARQIAR